MPAPLLTKLDMLGRLMDLFREKGFDGASLSDISAATGLGTAASRTTPHYSYRAR